MRSFTVGALKSAVLSRGELCGEKLIGGSDSVIFVRDNGGEWLNGRYGGPVMASEHSSFLFHIGASSQDSVRRLADCELPAFAAAMSRSGKRLKIIGAIADKRISEDVIQYAHERGLLVFYADKKRKLVLRMPPHIHNAALA